LRRCSDDETLISWLLPDVASLPGDPETLLLMTERCRDARITELLRDAKPSGPVNYWRSKRMSRLGFEGEDLPQGWLALGDALLHTPARQGRGLAQLSRQLEVLARGIADADAPSDILRRLLSISRETFFAASLAQSLWEQAPPISGLADGTELPVEACR
jgi:hypothetical protein